MGLIRCPRGDCKDLTTGSQQHFENRHYPRPGYTTACVTRGQPSVGVSPKGSERRVHTEISSCLLTAALFTTAQTGHHRRVFEGKDLQCDEWERYHREGLQGRAWQCLCVWASLGSPWNWILINEEGTPGGGRAALRIPPEPPPPAKHKGTNQLQLPRSGVRPEVTELGRVLSVPAIKLPFYRGGN